MKKLVFVLMVLSLATVVFADCRYMISEDNMDDFTNFLIDTPEMCGWKKTAFSYSNEYKNIKYIKMTRTNMEGLSEVNSKRIVFIDGKYIYYDVASINEEDKTDTLIEIWLSPDEKLLVGFATMIGNKRPYAYFFRNVDGDTIRGYSDHDKDGIYDYPFALDMKSTKPIPIQNVWEVNPKRLTRGEYSYKKYKENKGSSK